MEIEDKIRTQIEAILVNDARNYSEIKKMAEDDEPLDASLPTEERNLYHRIINSYRNAVSEVNKLLEESIGSLSGFYRIVESIKEKEDFQEICSQIVDCILQDFGADYCSLLFPESGSTLCLEGIREERKFLRIHSKTSLLGSREFEQQLTRMAETSGDCLNIEDIYKESSFNAVDFPGVVRSVLCLPMFLHGAATGFLVLSHSLPSYFHENHIRVLKILGSFIAHLRLLHQGGGVAPLMTPQARSGEEVDEEADAYSVVLMEFDTQDNYGRRIPLPRETVREIRVRLQRALETRESILFYGERDLLVLMPRVTSEHLPARIRGLREIFRSWQFESREDRANVRMNLGYSVCEGEEDLSRTLEVASLVMHPDSDDEPQVPQES
ncbi:MAG TPA: GAF domain-containing protein [Acidobacteriota bacterium]|nr:GAF domain-containing protein [Acidobacteriota bacterium]